MDKKLAQSTQTQLRNVRRNDRGRPRALDEDTIAALLNLRREMPKTTVPSLIAAMKQRHLIELGVTLTFLLQCFAQNGLLWSVNPHEI